MLLILDKDLSTNLTNSTDISEENVLEKGDSTQNIPDEIIIEEVDDSASIEKQKLVNNLINHLN